MASGQAVKLFVYDLTKGLASQLAPMIIGRPLDGIWHTSIVCYNQEFFFGGMGIESCPPCGTILGSPDKQVHLGSTEVPSEMFYEYLSQLGSDTFKPQKYELFHHNCNNFSSEVAQFLTGKDIPSYITDLPGEILSTPMGQMIKNMLENTQVSPGAGQTTRHF
ncbi:desumoylating isopeptidase 1-like [Styela clava]|uniref:desumoylating isopeptidase 1-like n=1 Tax=Styela clava TaxID=7725 RepID=UPI00193AB869|nr:desumoylating isopeptidase 1-like [Styela clava]